MSFNVIPPFKFWCQKILPLVYDDSLSYYELLCKVVHTLNEVIDNVNNIPEYIKEYLTEDNLRDILSELFDELRANIAIANEGESTTATSDRTVDELVWLNGNLYRITRAMYAGDRYVENSNCVKTTVEDELKRISTEIHGEVSTLSNRVDGVEADIDEIEGAVDKLKVIKYYNTFNDMSSDTELTAGDYCATLGYHSKGDGGKANYLITDSTSEGAVEISNGLYAKILIDYDISVKCFGAYGDGQHDDTNAIKLAIASVGGSHNITFPALDEAVKAYNILFPSGVYLISEEIVINKNNIYLVGEGELNTVIKCSTNRIIESLFTFTGAYGCGIKNMQLNGAIPKTSTVRHNPVNYGACCGLWLDQVAYSLFENVMICNTRNQGMRWCHVWQDTFNNIKIYYTSNYGTSDHNGKYYGVAIWQSISNQIDTTFNPSETVKTSESNQITVNRLEVSGLLGGTFAISNDFYNNVVQNCVFTDVIEENDLFNWANSSDLPDCFDLPAWDFQGLNRFVNPPISESVISIINHYVYYHHYSFNKPKRIYFIASDHVRISNSIVFNGKSNDTYSPYSDICYVANGVSASDIDIHVIEENYSNDQTKGFNSIVHCQNLYGVNCFAQGKVQYTRHWTALTELSVSNIITNPSLFIGNVILNNPSGVNVFTNVGTAFPT